MIKNQKPEPLHEKIAISNINQLISLFSDKKDLMVLSSSRLMEGYGRYSWICFDAFWSFSSKGKFDQNPFDIIQDYMDTFKIKKMDNLPPFQGGAVGYFGYEAGHYLEELPVVNDHIQLPDIYLNFYSTVIAVDHALNQSWVIATGFPETTESRRIKKAKNDIINVQNICRLGLGPTKQYRSNSCWAEAQPTANFERDSYLNAVNIMKEYILNGDIFEANLSQQFNTDLSEQFNPLDLYFHLMKINPAPFSAFMKLPNQDYIISASPERFIKLTGQSVETCPIKGTRKRSPNPQEDQRLAIELSNSEKDHAENVMIVDLMRNDLSKVCHSVHVDELCALKSFETVHHLVSKVSGILKNHNHAMELLKAAFPPGSVTGAPKIRAMEIISELEQQTRGPYCGSLGYLAFNGDMDLSVIIRTYFIHKNKLFFSAGGAIVLDSIPEEEYQESLIKANALIRALSYE
jgi:para-aminobenzoate synthetase component 1